MGGGSEERQVKRVKKKGGGSEERQAKTMKKKGRKEIGYRRGEGEKKSKD